MASLDARTQFHAEARERATTALRQKEIYGALRTKAQYSGSLDDHTAANQAFTAYRNAANDALRFEIFGNRSPL